MKRILPILLLTTFFSCTSAQEKPIVGSSAYELMLQGLLDRDVPEMSIEQLDKTAPQYVLLDARERNEFDVSHIENARWVGYDDFSLERVAGIPKDTSIVVYCSVGYRSEKVTQQLLEAGFTDVQNLYGGIFEWTNQKGDLIDPQGRPTEKIHAYDKVWGVWVSEGKKVYK